MLLKIVANMAKLARERLHETEEEAEEGDEYVDVLRRVAVNK